MTENGKFTEATLDAYGYDKKHNITENGVLMVTITLDEYRALVEQCAKAEQIKHDKSLWEYEREVKALKEKLYQLTVGGTDTDTDVCE